MLYNQKILDRTQLKHNSINKSKIVTSTSNEYYTNTIHNSTKRESNQIKDRHSSIPMNKVPNLNKIITTKS